MNKSIAITDDTVINKIYQIRGKKVMLDRDLVVSDLVVSGRVVRRRVVSRSVGS